MIQTRDLRLARRFTATLQVVGRWTEVQCVFVRRQWPGGYGRGSGTVAKWIQERMDEDAKEAGGASEQAEGMFFPGQTKPFPSHWGKPDFQMMTMDHREWPDGYGHGSGTVYHWIQQRIEEDMRSDS
eukprot:scaffold2504_cov405-Prasinococcus_capsulatus_cf.AAC.3